MAHSKQWFYGSVCQYISESVGFYFSHSRSAICFPWLPGVKEYSPDVNAVLCSCTKTITRAGKHPAFTHVLLLTPLLFAGLGGLSAGKVHFHCHAIVYFMHSVSLWSCQTCRYFFFICYPVTSRCV